jgi:hypothetical protein
MRAVFNHLAAERGQPGAPLHADRFELGKGIALLRATPKPKVAKPAPVISAKSIEQRPSVIRDCALKELSKVVGYTHSETGEFIAASFFEAGDDDSDEWQSTGASYFEIVRVVRKRFPKSRISPNMLRKLVHYVKVVAEAGADPVGPEMEGFRNVVLPERRPKSKGVPNVKRAAPERPRKPRRRVPGAKRKSAANHGAKRRRQRD